MDICEGRLKRVKIFFIDNKMRKEMEKLGNTMSDGEIGKKCIIKSIKLRIFDDFDLFRDFFYHHVQYRDWSKA